MVAAPYRSFRISPHAQAQIARRGLTVFIVAEVLARPEQEFVAWPGRVILQSRIVDAELNRIQLVRVFVDVLKSPVEVVSAYRTSRVLKYWRENP